MYIYVLTYTHTQITQHYVVWSLGFELIAFAFDRQTPHCVGLRSTGFHLIVLALDRQGPPHCVGFRSTGSNSRHAQLACVGGNADPISSLGRWSVACICPSDEKERERERQRQRKTDRHTHTRTHTDTQRGRRRERERARERDTLSRR